MYMLKCFFFLQRKLTLSTVICMTECHFFQMFLQFKSGRAVALCELCEFKATFTNCQVPIVCPLCSYQCSLFSNIFFNLSLFKAIS